MDPVSDDLWEAIQPLLPPEPVRRGGGPARVPHRAGLGGILYVLRHELRWNELPQELGFGSGVTCWRRLRQWTQATVVTFRTPTVRHDRLAAPVLAFLRLACTRIFLRFLARAEARTDRSEV